MPRALILVLASSALAAAAPAQEGGVDTVGRAVARRFAELGKLPDPSTIVVADIINYHRHAIPVPTVGESIALDLRWDAPLPAELGESVLQIGIATTRVHDTAFLPPLDLAIVVDRSGSMAAADKLDRVKQALRRFVAELRPSDRIALVAYSNDAEVVLPSRSVGDGEAVRRAIAALESGGGTNLHGGLMLGYRELDDRPGSEAERRVILLTDGRANAGTTDPAEIALQSGRFNARGIDVSTIGVGQDFNHDLLEQLARVGRGSFHFVADEQDIEKVFVDEVQSLLGVVARDVELTIEHGEDVELAHVYGYPVDTEARTVKLRLDDFNYGMTRVVLAKFRATGGDRKPQPIDVRLSVVYDDGGAHRALADRTRFVPPARGAIDHEVRKNFTIAVMARALRRMAEDAEAKRFGDAERHLTRALDYARIWYPDTRDADLTSVRGMLESYRTIVSRRIECFRDL